MKRHLNNSIKAITEGGIFTAIYALLAIISRYLITGTDSMMYYFTPLPIAIYVVRNKLSYSTAVFFASVALSFLFANPLIALMVIMPNIIVGFVLGCMERYSKIKLLNYFSIFFLCLIVNLISIAAYEIITGIKYFEDIANLSNNIASSFGLYNQTLINSIVEIFTIVIIIIDSLIKTILLYLVLSIIILRLKLVKDYTFKIKLPLKFKFTIALGYIFSICMLAGVVMLYSNYLNIFFKLLMIIVITAVFIYSFYLLYQFIFFIKFRFDNLNKVVYILIAIFSVLLMPIPVIVAVILNLINYNILLDFI